MDVIFDIDGTIADLSHRLHWIKTKPKNYPAFMEACFLDRPIKPIIDVLRAIHENGDRIIMCSGRSGKYAEKTIAWLREMSVPFDLLYMREEGDYRKDSIIKSELLDRMIREGFRPEMAFDDRQQVVDMWRERGLICAQVAKGDF